MASFKLYVNIAELYMEYGRLRMRVFCQFSQLENEFDTVENLRFDDRPSDSPSTISFIIGCGILRIFFFNHDWIEKGVAENLI